MFVTPREYSQYSLGPTGQQPAGRSLVDLSLKTCPSMACRSEVLKAEIADREG